MILLKCLIRKIKLIKEYYNFCEFNHISAYSAKSSYFLIMSFIPILIIILFILLMLNTFGFVKLNSLNNVLSNELFIKLQKNNDYITYILNIIFAIAVSAWSGGKAFYSLTEAFNNIIHNKKSKNYISKRLKASLLSIIFAFIIVCLIIIGLFGEKIVISILNINQMKNIFGILKLIFFGVSVWVLITLAYICLPDWNDNSIIKIKIPVKLIIKYSAISSLCICLFMFIFSIYISFRLNYILNYDSSTVIIAFMLWLYFSIYILILIFNLMYTKICTTYKL